MNEFDSRIRIVETIMNTPHGNLDGLFKTHEDLMRSDPMFYAKFSIYYDRIGSVRDHKKILAAQILTGELVEFRELGELLMLTMSPKDFHQTVELALKHRDSGGKRRRINKVSTRYIRSFERTALNGDSFRFLKNSKFLRALYTRLHIKPSPEAAASLKLLKVKLADEVTPYVSFVEMKKLSTMSNEAEICQFIQDSQIPALQIFGALPISITPAIAAAMTLKMSPKEMQAFSGMLQKKGLLEDPQFKDLFKKKLTKKGAELSMRGTAAKKSLGKDADIMTAATDSFVASLPTIRRKILLAIDKSNSMTQAITLGKDVASILSSKVEDPERSLFITAFNNTCVPIPIPSTRTHSEFEMTFRFMNANGTTSLGAPIEFAFNRGFTPEVVLFITDGKENDAPLLKNSLQNFPQIKHSKIIFCLVGNNPKRVTIDSTLQGNLGLEVENVDFSSGDYYSLPNLLNLISKGGIRDLIQEIDEINLFEEISKRRAEVANVI